MFEAWRLTLIKRLCVMPETRAVNFLGAGCAAQRRVPLAQLVGTDMKPWGFELNTGFRVSGVLLIYQRSTDGEIGCAITQEPNYAYGCRRCLPSP